MDLIQELDIVLITYNRCSCLEETLKEILADSSPIKNCDITILNNCSDDNTNKLVEEYCQNYKNLKLLTNKKNIGGCANIVKALSEIPNKKYVWVLCDNDRYDWSEWNKIEYAIENDFDLIMTRKCQNTPSDIMYMTNLVSGAIYKTQIITSTIIENMYDFIKYLFPHLALGAYVINNNKKIFTIDKDIVKIGINPDHDKTVFRGIIRNDLSESRRNIFWSVGFISTLELINNKKLRYEIIDNLRHYRKSLFDLFKSIMIKNKVFFNNNFDNLKQIWRFLNFRQKVKFIFAFIYINLSLKDYSFYEVCTNEDWLNYLNKINEKEYLKKISKKLKDKKILLYGAGMFYDILKDNFDLSELNIVAISDKKFETIDKDLKEYKGLKTVKPSEIKDFDCDVILFSLKLYKHIAKSFKKQGVNKKMLPILNNNYKYALRS